LRGEEFLNIDEYKSAKFVSNSIHIVNDTTAKVNGELTFLGVTKKITVQVTLVGEGKDPWGGYRIGFEGMSSFAMKDFDMKRDLGDKSQKVDVFFSVEGIRAAE
jgi:polyisoprenoid-binding protein YceI